MPLKRLYEDALAHAVAYGVRPRIMTRPRYFGLFRRRGYHVVPVHFYQPIPDTRRLPESTWTTQSEMPGIDMNDAGQVELLGRMRTLKAEYDALESASTYRFDNPNFSSVDAETLYCMIRLGTPRRMVEVGSGFSTLVASAAAARNLQDSGCAPELVCVEPYPPRCLDPRPPQISRFISSGVQDVPMAEFAALGPGDILFIDSTHVLAIGSDVQRLFLEVLPRLAAGVIVHIHDIFFPGEYPREWAVDRHLFWTEQYLLQAFLAHNESWRVLWCGNWMRERHAGLLREAFASFARTSPPPRPSSFWMQRVR